MDGDEVCPKPDEIIDNTYSLSRTIRIKEIFMTMAKLTLTAETDLISEAKHLASVRKTSVSALFSSFVKSMTLPESKKHHPLAPITQKATGLLDLNSHREPKEILTEALLEKYGLDR
jgi:hypothetical protein